MVTKEIKDKEQIFDGWNVTRALLHQGIEIPFGGGSTTSLYAETSSGVGRGRGGFKMKYNKDGLFCEYKGLAFIIPLANVVQAFIG